MTTTTIADSKTILMFGVIGWVAFFFVLILHLRKQRMQTSAEGNRRLSIISGMIFVVAAFVVGLFPEYKAVDFISGAVGVGAAFVGIAVEIFESRVQAAEVRDKLSTQLTDVWGNLKDQLVKMELHLSKLQDGREPSLEPFREPVLNLFVPQQRRLDLLKSRWILQKAAEYSLKGYYLAHFEDSDEPLRINLLADAVKHAEHSVLACTYADSDHIRRFWRAKVTITDYVAAHQERMEKEKKRPSTPAFLLQRVFVIPEGLSGEDATHLTDAIKVLLAIGMTELYWIPWTKAEKALSDGSFPCRSFLLVDDTFVSEGIPVRRIGEKKRSDEKRLAYVWFDSNPKALQPFRTQIERLVEESSQLTPDTISTLETFLKTARPSASAAPRLGFSDDDEPKD